MKFLIPFLIASSLSGQTPVPAWVAKSNQNAQILIAVGAKYSPESASSEGVPGLDEKVSVFSADQTQKHRADLVKARQHYRRISKPREIPWSARICRF
jgi:hypothetical protein